MDIQMFGTLVTVFNTAQNYQPFTAKKRTK